ncbi:MAG: hypothetical protein SGPRY_011624, partial [Prymnesium sp.]
AKRISASERARMKRARKEAGTSADTVSDDEDAQAEAELEQELPLEQIALAAQRQPAASRQRRKRECATGLTGQAQQMENWLLGSEQAATLTAARELTVAATSAVLGEAYEQEECLRRARAAEARRAERKRMS